MQTELQKRVSGFDPEEVIVHNTYLEILVEHGLAGLALYAWLMVGLFRLARKPADSKPEEGPLDTPFRSLWPVLMLVYLVNASFVVMNYQFVNGWFFTLAGMLAAQIRREESQAHELS